MRFIGLVVLLIVGCSAQSYYQRPNMDRPCYLSAPSQGLPSCAR